MSQPKMICEDCRQPCSARVTGLGSDRVEVFSDCDAPCRGDAILLHLDGTPLSDDELCDLADDAAADAALDRACAGTGD